MTTVAPNTTARRSTTGPFRALGNRAFALLWGGQALSRIGDALFQIALAWWVLEKTNSATAMAGLLMAIFVPTLICLLIGGVVVDRFSRVRIMLLADLVRGSVVSTVAALAWFDHLQLWHLFALNLVFGVVDAFFQPAYTAAVPDLVLDDALPSANALTGMSVQVGQIAGPALGAVIVASGGASLAFALNGLTFFVAAALLLPLLHQKASRTAEPPQIRIRETLADMRIGLGDVLTTPWLWRTILVFALGNVALSGPFGIALPFLVSDHMRADVGTLSLFYGLFAAGYLIGGLCLARNMHVRHRGYLIYGGMAVAGLGLSVFGLPLPLTVLCIAAVINGAALEIGSLAWTSALQQLIPRERLGRVASIDTLGSFALIPFGYALTGWATDALGAPLIFIIGGGLTTIVVVLTFISQPAIRSLD